VEVDPFTDSKPVCRMSLDSDDHLITDDLIEYVCPLIDFIAHYSCGKITNRALIHGIECNIFRAYGYQQRLVFPFLI
jgi:hypothetical protein